MDCGDETTYELRHSYHYQACDNPGDDPGDGCRGCGDDGSGGGGTGGDGGGVFVPNMPQTMPIQLTIGSCVPSALAQVKSALCGGSQTAEQVEAEMMLYGSRQYGVFFARDGVPLSGMNSFVSNYFNTTILYPIGDFKASIDAGHPIVIDIFSHIEGNTAVYHCVIVTGYNSVNTYEIYYLDPATGTTKSGDAAYLFSNANYAIPITGCK